MRSNALSAQQAQEPELPSDRPLSKPGALEQVLTRLDNGESAKSISQDLGISDVALYRYLIRNAPEQWKAISTGNALARLDSEDRAMDHATNGIMLGRARERMAQARWTLERTARNIYGDQELKGINAAQLTDLLLAVSERMLAEKQVNAINEIDNKDK